MRMVIIGSVVLAAAASAAPPPPPPLGDASALHQFVQALQAKDASAYSSTLADDVEVMEGKRFLAHSKTEWMKAVVEEFSRQNRIIRSEGVWVGADIGDRDTGESSYKALILERDDQVFGDCCVYHRTELLTFRNHKIAKIELSPSFSLELRNDGRRQDEP